ncbi:Yip1 family protein [Melioribacter sp. OK-6-Me]|uniref:Yip1 family protein n=1 Tax=unclassified Melioribacter TaxID=2627329 RepID=UPI003ED991DB
MDEKQDNQIPKMSSVQEEEEMEFSHTDKLVGVFSEPAATFEKLKKIGPKTSDWLIPIFIVIVAAIFSNVIMMSNPAIKLSIVEKQMAQIEKNFDEAVQSGQMTEVQKEEQLEQIRERMEKGGSMAIVFTAISILFITFITFFIVAGVYFLVCKLLLKGDGTFKDTMSAYGLPYYIIVIQIIVMVIIALVTNKYITSTSVAAIMNIDKSKFLYFLLSRVDIFSIWFYSVVSIALAKMFNSEKTGKYFATIFGLWIGVGFIFWWLAANIPFLAFLQQ